MASQYQIMGINDDHDACSKCGKTHLKKVVWLKPVDGDVFPVGTTCAAKFLSIKKRSPKAQTAEIENIAYQQLIERAKTILDGFVPIQKRLYPKGIIKMVADRLGYPAKTIEGFHKTATEIRIEMYPVLGILNDSPENWKKYL